MQETKGKLGRYASVDKAQQEKVSPDWFKAFTNTEVHDENFEAAYKEQLAQLKAMEDKVATFLGDGVDKLSYKEYEDMLQEEDLRQRISIKLMQNYDYLNNYSVRELSDYIKKADKDLFLKLKDGVYTLDQLKARVAERKIGLKYVVLDDLRH